VCVLCGVAVEPDRGISSAAAYRGMINRGAAVRDAFDMARKGRALLDANMISSGRSLTAVWIVTSIKTFLLYQIQSSKPGLLSAFRYSYSHDLTWAVGPRHMHALADIGGSLGPP
jgi:hypothetical protein